MDFRIKNHIHCECEDTMAYNVKTIKDYYFKIDMVLKLTILSFRSSLFAITPLHLHWATVVPLFSFL